jgi:DnaJ-class molecular chaperone
MNKDLYETLGVSKSASEDELKKAYIKGIHKHDFKQISSI